jgi:hypothetical protein
MVLRSATKDKNVPRPRTSVTVALALDVGLLWRMWAREYSRMLLTHSDSRLARQVDKPRFVGPHRSVQSGIVSRKRRRNTVRWDGIEDADPRPTLIRAPKRL